jgi:membrane dipeptidase
MALPFQSPFKTPARLKAPSLNLSRRQWLGTAVGAVAAGTLGAAYPQGGGTPAAVMPKPFVADMHSHFGMFLPRIFGLEMARHMCDNGLVLMSWAIVDDRPWIKSGGDGLKQGSTPKKGEIYAYWEELVQDYKQRLKKWNVPLALTPADIDAALAGSPHLLLACESANFTEGDPRRLADAYAIGVRHIHNPIGDHQTAESVHGGLSPVGAEVVRECQRLGMVIDLAHGTSALVDGALDACDAAMVWSHSWVTSHGGTSKDPGYIARSLSEPAAKKIAARGGAVGLWCLRNTSDPAYPVRSTQTYADEIMRMCDLLGPAHVAFGTDMEGVWPRRVLNDYADLREVVNSLVKRGLSEDTLNGVLHGNYIRVVKAAMAGRKAGEPARA